MIIFIFLDNIYYSIYNFYKSKGENEPWIPASILTTFAPQFNIYLIIFIFEYKNNLHILNKTTSLFFGISAIILSWYRYNKCTNYEKIAKRHSTKTVDEKNKLISAILIYCLLSFLLLLVTSIYIGETRNPPPFWDNWF